MAQPATAPTRAPVTTANAAPKLAFAKPEFTGERTESIIPPEVTHVILAGGFYGSGKTTFVAGIDDPRNELFIDLESKGEGVAKRIGISNYFCPPQEAASLWGFTVPPVKVYDRVQEIIEAIPQGRFSVLILDGLTILQDSMLEKVKASPTSFGVNPAHAISGSMGGAWPGVGLLLQRVFNVARAKGVQVIAVTTEAKAKWGSAGPVLNKFELKGQSIIHKMSILSVIMLPGLPEYAGAPSALVLKEQLGKYEFKGGKLETTKCIPPKLPLASMETVYQYLKKPADYMNLRKEEIPSEDEIEPFRTIVAKDQLATYMELLKAARLGAAEDVEE